MCQRCCAGKGPIAMLDRCPHRAAALSQGRMTAAGNLQCAYHGMESRSHIPHATEPSALSDGLFLQDPQQTALLSEVLVPRLFFRARSLCTGRVDV